MILLTETTALVTNLLFKDENKINYSVAAGKIRIFLVKIASYYCTNLFFFKTAKALRKNKKPSFKFIKNSLKPIIYFNEQIINLNYIKVHYALTFLAYFFLIYFLLIRY